MALCCVRGVAMRSRPRLGRPTTAAALVPRSCRRRTPALAPLLPCVRHSRGLASSNSITTAAAESGDAEGHGKYCGGAGAGVVHIELVSDTM
jgi:hypothetical protein